MRRSNSRPGSTAGLLAAAAIILGAGLAVAQTPIPPVCPMPVDPVPSGPNQRPLDIFADPALFSNPTTSNDYHWVHSSTHLQGEPALEKFAPCLFYRVNDPSVPIDMTGFRSAVIVNNPDPFVGANVTVQYRDPLGAPLGPPINFFLGPEATWVRGAIELALFGTGLGSAHIIADQPIVGGSLHYTDHVTLNGIAYSDPDILQPGANSMQQLQVSQSDATTLYWGPLPVTNTFSEDFLNGNLPLFCVFNPNPIPVNLTVGTGFRVAGPLPPQFINLNPFGMYVDTSLWALLEPFYSTNMGAPFNDDAYAVVASTDGPIIGEGLLGDFYGDGIGPMGELNLVKGARFRMGSTMMANDLALRVVNPELTYEVTTPPVTSNMSFMNFNTVDIGPVQIDYFDRNGNLLSTVSIASFPSGAVARLSPGLLGYPPAPVFAGWARVTACDNGLVGWTMREIHQQLFPAVQHFRKAYGEILSGSNGLEPGDGFPITDPAGLGIFTRKVAILDRAAGPNDIPPWWPSYTTFVNDSVPNINPYLFRFFTLPGANVGQALFQGLQWAHTSFTYEDPIVNVPFGMNLSGRVDHTTGTIEGIDVIGDPMREWQIPNYPTSSGGTYEGPGDVVPPHE